eukprot:9439664-Pyramimonas_sp.AAC.1
MRACLDVNVFATGSRIQRLLSVLMVWACMAGAQAQNDDVVPNNPLSPGAEGVESVVQEGQYGR